VSTPPPKRENVLVNLICNIALPTLILSKFSGDRTLGPVGGLVVALAFPLGYGIHDFIQRRRTNFVSLIGFASVLLSGGLGLMKVGGLGFAIKDAAVPSLIGLGVLASLRSKTPIVREIFFNEQIIDVARVDTALETRGQRPAFERLLVQVSFWLAGAFIVSAVLNFFLARHLLVSPAGTTEFNAELGKMHWASMLVISVPFMVVTMVVFWRLLVGLQQLTGLTTDEIFHAEQKK
jgi:hypothetical protein